MRSGIDIPSRRKFLLGGGSFTAALGAPIPFLRNLPSGVVPVASAQPRSDIPPKQGLALLSDRPLNAETPAHLIDHKVTPGQQMLIRDNGVGVVSGK